MIDIKEILRLHKLWILSDSSGKKADLRGADLRGADLRGADLKCADLSGADLMDADLSVADLRGADLMDADLRGADLRDADLMDADLRGADLKGADLRDADLRGANLDYSCWPLWCGSLKPKAVDIKLIRQLLYHTLACAKVCDDPEAKKLLSLKSVKTIANKFHLVERTGELE